MNISCLRREESLWGEAGKDRMLGEERRKLKEEADVPKASPLLVQVSSLSPMSLPTLIASVPHSGLFPIPLSLQ